MRPSNDPIMMQTTDAKKEMILNATHTVVGVDSRYGKKEEVGIKRRVLSAEANYR